jgi:parallel beta-helix repeat protein
MFLAFSVCFFLFQKLSLTYAVENKSIQDMINEATIGGVVKVPKGIYYENVIVNKTVTLIGEGEDTIIDGFGAGSVFTVSARDVIIANFTIQNSGFEWAAIHVDSQEGVNIFSNVIKSNYYGLYLKNCSYANITGNILRNNNIAVWFETSRYINFSNNFLDWNYGQAVNLVSCTDINVAINEIKNNPAYGIYLERTNQSKVSENKISYVCDGLFLQESFGNNISANFISNTGPYGLYLNYSEMNIIEGNFLADNEIAVQLWSSRNNSLSGNNIAKNKFGLLLWFSGKNVLEDNALCYNTWSFGVHGYQLDDFLNDVAVSNTVNELPVYYWVSKTGGRMPEHAGFIGVVDSTEVEIKDVNIENNFQGVLLAFSNSTLIEKVNLTANWHGIYFINSNNNTLFGSNLINNFHNFFIHSSNSNIFYSNNFVGGKEGYFRDSENFWDAGYPRGGNYWSYYEGKDERKGETQREIGSDGIGDSPQTVNGDFDNYPLISPITFYELDLFEGTVYEIGFSVNALITNVDFNSSEALLVVRINLTVPEVSCRIVIPKALLRSDDGWVISANGEAINFTVTEDNLNTYICLTVYEGLNTINLKGTVAVHENPCLPLLLILWIAIILIEKLICMMCAQPFF